MSIFGFIVGIIELNKTFFFFLTKKNILALHFSGAFLFI